MPIRKDLGNDLWKFLHTMALIIDQKPTPKHIKKEFDMLEKAIIKLMPCPKCRTNWETHINSIPKTNSQFERYYHIHNKVNKSIYKKHKISLEDARKLYESLSHKPREILIIMAKITITYTNHWNRVSWRSKSELNKTKHIFRIPRITHQILNLPYHQPKSAPNADSAYSYQSVRKLLTEHNSIKVSRDFRPYDTSAGGCNCGGRKRQSKV